MVHTMIQNVWYQLVWIHSDEAFHQTNKRTLKYLTNHVVNSFHLVNFHVTLHNYLSQSLTYWSFIDDPSIAGTKHCWKPSDAAVFNLLSSCWTGRSSPVRPISPMKQVDAKIGSFLRELSRLITTGKSEDESNTWMPPTALINTSYWPTAIRSFDFNTDNNSCNRSNETPMHRLCGGRNCELYLLSSDWN